MNAITTSVNDRLPIEPFALATSQVNEWRGRCLDAFVRAEAAVTDCLACMSAIKGHGDTVRLPHLVGQRFDELAGLIGEGGLFHAEAGSIPHALQGFRQHDDLRTALCHGVAHVTLDSRARWTVLLRVTAFRSKSIFKTTLPLTRREAEQLRDELHKASQALCSCLGQLRARLASSEAP